MFWQGHDNQEQIKYFIKRSIEEWKIKYVLLVGGMKKQSGEWHLPVRYINLDDKGGLENKYISDLYYADIYDSNGNFSSWDTNNNHIFGEWIGNKSEDKNIDLYPDVAVGRLACRNSYEVKSVVNKIINYETLTYGSDWFKKIIVATGDPFLDTDEIEGENGSLLILENMSKFKPIKLWASDGTLKKAYDIIKKINEGCGFLYLGGHGTPRVWLTYNPNNGKKIKFNKYQMMFLNNYDKLPICITTGCANNQIDVTIKNLFINPLFSLRPAISSWVPRSFGWKLVSKSNGGSIATIGNIGEAYGGKHTSQGVDESWNGGMGFITNNFFKAYNQSNLDILGETWNKTIHTYLDNFPINWDTAAGEISSIDAKTVQGWILLGDPSLKIGGYPKPDN